MEREREKKRTEVVHKDIRIVEWKIDESAEIKKIRCHKAVETKNMYFSVVRSPARWFLLFYCCILCTRSDPHAQIKLSTSEK